MLSIYKYGFEVCGGDIRMPTSFKVLRVLDVQYQPQAYPLEHEFLTVWALVDLESSVGDWIDVQVFGTGHDISGDSGDIRNTHRYFKTVLMPSGLVWHVFLAKGVNDDT